MIEALDQAILGLLYTSKVCLYMTHHKGQAHIPWPRFESPLLTTIVIINITIMIYVWNKLLFLLFIISRYRLDANSVISLW